MYTKISTIAWVCFFGLWLVAGSAWAQGNLTPSGAPAPTMKSLDQIEARTAITNTISLVTIAQSGSYYLTHNLTVSTGDAIDITTNNVTLDLNGFTISSTAASSTGVAILLGSSSALRNVTILNGFIKSGTTNNGLNVYAGSGFNYGISFNAQPTMVSVRDVTVSGCLQAGIYLTQNGSLVENCKVLSTGGMGIYATTVRQCVVRDCGNGAIQCEGAYDCSGETTSLNVVYTIVGSVVQNCSGTCVNGYAISGTTVNNCSGVAYGAGVGIYATVANNCSGTSSSGAGLVIVESAHDCTGSCPAGTGIELNNRYGVLHDCTAKSSTVGIDMGIYATIINCAAIGNNSNGVVAGQSCVIRGCTVNANGGSSGTNGIGIIAGIRTTIEDCIVIDNRNDGILAAGDSSILNNHVSHNGVGVTSAGIHTSGSGSRIEGNQLRDNNGYGIKSDGGANADIIIRNLAGANSINYQPSNGSYFGPVQTPVNATNVLGNL